LSRQIKEASKYVEEKFKILDIRMQESSEVLRNVASLRERISKEIELQNDNINSLRTNLTEMIENLNAEIKDNRRTAQSNFENCQKDNLLLSEKIKAIDINIENIDSTLQNNRELHR
jgi:chromosome segregation ATPase